MMIKTRKYWVLQFLPLVVVGFGGWRFREFVTEAVTRNPALNASILGAIGFAASLCLLRMTAFQREASTLSAFHRAYGQSNDAHTAAQAIASRETYMARLLNVVGGFRGQLANRIEQASLLHELDEIKSAYSHSLSLPQFLSGFMIALGLFGTFIGLLETLQHTAGLIAGVTVTGGNADNAIEGLIKGIQGPLAGMGTAFSASLFGLLGSLVVGSMLSGLQSLSHLIVYRARMLIDQVVSVESSMRDNAELLSAAQVTELAGRLVQYETVAVELYARSRRADLETRHQLTDVAARLGETATHMAHAMNGMRELGAAVSEQTRHMAGLREVMGALTEAVPRIEAQGERIGQAVSELREMGITARRAVEVATALERQSTTSARQVDASHHALASAVQSLAQRHLAAESAFSRLSESVSDVPAILRQLERISALVSSEAGSVLDRIEAERTEEAHRRAADVRELERIQQLLVDVRNLVAELARTGRGVQAASADAGSDAAQPVEVIGSLTTVLAGFQSGFEELLKEIVQRTGRATLS
ncbi:hypothetical protein [Burkholderia pyrrocinia]|uniref:hypothetical protein n=1 Tax=Burkholderia pyrrocinia TaxID=60550 RepID=UPI00158DE55E|nr:hypothetical protein [Burkholderia pyrrocinia]